MHRRQGCRAHALFEAAAAWVRERGIHRIRGPFSFSVADDWGWKCDLAADMPAGYDTMPMVYQPHEFRRIHNDFAVSWGMTKLQDHLAYHLDMVKGLSEKMHRVFPRSWRKKRANTAKSPTAT